MNIISQNVYKLFEHFRKNRRLFYGIKISTFEKQCGYFLTVSEICKVASENLCKNNILPILARLAQNIQRPIIKGVSTRWNSIEANSKRFIGFLVVVGGVEDVEESDVVVVVSAASGIACSSLLIRGTEFHIDPERVSAAGNEFVVS